MATAIAIVVLLAAAGAVSLHLGSKWGATDEERRSPMPGDDWMPGGRGIRVRMTRAITLAAPPEAAWPWLAQLGRGAGWYSIDRLDNGGRVSAQHIVSWIPPPALGDATAIGYLRHLDAGRSLAWWIPSGTLLGSRFRSASTFLLSPAGAGCRLVTRFSWVVGGPTALLVVPLFRGIDSIMAIRQLYNLERRVRLAVGESPPPADEESGERDQYQLYHAIFASGEEAGRAGREEACRWRTAARSDGVLPSNPSRQTACS